MIKRWLHISDLHLGNNDLTSSMLRDALPQFISDNFKSDYVFVTGDIRTASMKQNQFTPEMKDFLMSVCEAAGVTYERLFIVPGNHDIDRNVDGRDEAVRRVMFHRDGYYDPSHGGIECSDMERILDGEKEFFSFLSSIFPEGRRSKYGNPDAPHFNVETEDFNILHVDSTLSYTKDQEANDLIVGTKAVYDALQTINKDKPTILLTHYPFTSLLQDEKKKLSDLLWTYGVRLWLAGHEHDQNLQPNTYLTSLQAGELRYEKGVGPTFLVGEYDCMTGHCRVRAYRWFSEGWAKYPFVRKDGIEKDVFEFSLLPLNVDNGSVMGKLASRANESYLVRMPQTVEKSLFPKLAYNDKVLELDGLFEENWEKDADYVLLLADGGMGKSTMLMDSCRNSTIPSLYIPTDKFSALGMSIEKYCVDSLFDGDYGRFQRTLQDKFKTPTLRVIIDGLNEVNSSDERRFVNEIQRIGILKGIQLVVASRSDFTLRYGSARFERASLLPLEEQAVRKFFNDREWAHIKDSRALDRLLRNPMMVTIYREICSVIDEFCNVEFLDWRLPVGNVSDLFHNYYLSQVALMMKRGTEGRQVLMAMECIYDILPAIAYEYEKSFCLNKTNPEFRNLLKQILSETKFQKREPVREFYRMFGESGMTEGEVVDMLSSTLHLLYKEGPTVDFPHQIYRDYLSALWIANESDNTDSIEEIWNTREIPFPVMEHIRRSSGAYWKGIADKIHAVGVGRDDVGILVQNLLDCFPSDEIGGVADYSGLNLSYAQLPDNFPFPKRISLDGASVGKRTLGLASGELPVYRNLAFSDDCSFVAATADRKISIFSLKDNGRPFVYDIGKKATKLLFCDDRLFVSAGSVTVFSYDGEWRYVGEIMEPHGHLITSKLKSITLCEDVVRFSYTNKEVRYILPTGHIIPPSNWSKFSPDSSLWNDLTELRHSERKRAVFPGMPNDAVDFVEKGMLRVVSYSDGRVLVFSEKELLKVLARGVSVLMDAAISADGTKAVTLSLTTFDSKRRILIWNLDDGVKIGEIFCCQSIDNIHLSGNGRWIMGDMDGTVWIYDCELHEEKFIKGPFVSNQCGKLVTYGDKVLINNATGGMHLYNLETGESSPIYCPYDNPKLVWFMNDGTLGAVNHRGNALSFKSSRGDENHTISYSLVDILSVHPFRQKPFIAVFTSDGMLSVYHTGTKQRLRKLQTQRPSKLSVAHPSLTVIARSDGYRYLEVDDYHEWNLQGKDIGHWRVYPYRGKQGIDIDILDMAFNEKRHLLAVILASGKIMYFDERNCVYDSTFQIVTAFNMDAYDFSACNGDNEIVNILRLNGCGI